MFTHRKTRARLLLLLALFVLAPAALFLVPRLITTMRMLSVVRRVAAGEIAADPSVREEKIVRRMAMSELEGLVYRPSTSSPASAIVLVAGVSELGCYHPRLVSLSRALAHAGYLVLTPDIRMLREFRIHPPPLDEISFWLHEVRGIEGSRSLKRVGLAGISFSATLCLIAAAQAQNRDQVSYLLGIGAFDDLVRCSSFWFDAGPVTVSPGYYPTRFYAKWVIMLSALDLLSNLQDRRFLQALLQNLLLQKEIPATPESLTDAGRRWQNLALLREDQSDPELAQQIEDHVARLLYPELSTKEPAAEIRCPVFLAHGAFDDLIPSEESSRLQEKIINAESHLLISPFLTHTHPREKTWSFTEKTRAALDLFGFFYRLTGVL